MKSKTELLTRGSWHEIKHTVSNSEYFLVLDPCKEDDRTTFFANGKAMLTEGATKCNESAPQEYNFNWFFMENETRINIWGIEYMIVSLTESKFVVQEGFWYQNPFTLYRKTWYNFGTITYSH